MRAGSRIKPLLMMEEAFRYESGLVNSNFFRLVGYPCTDVGLVFSLSRLVGLVGMVQKRAYLVLNDSIAISSGPNGSDVTVSD